MPTQESQSAQTQAQAPSGSPQSVDETLALLASGLVLAGLSKVHGLPGLRAGWLVVRDAQLREALINWKFYTSICPPAPSEFLALAALNALMYGLFAGQFNEVLQKQSARRWLNRGGGSALIGAGIITAGFQQS